MSNNFDNLINEDINWREGEIATLKSLCVSPNLSKNKKEVILKYTIPALYAIWEGFIVHTFTEYIRLINAENIDISKANINLVMYSGFSDYSLNNIPTHYFKKIKLIRDLYHFYQGKLRLNTNISTNSNVDLKTLNIIMKRYDVEEINTKYTGSLHKFLEIRNKIAHGDNNVQVEQSLVDEFSDLILELIYDVFDNVIKAYHNKSYLSCSMLE